MSFFVIILIGDISMKIINIKENDKYLTEYIKLCNLEWGSKKITPEYIENKKIKISKRSGPSPLPIYHFII